MLFVWTRATDVPGILTYDAFYGISSGKVTSLLTKQTPDSKGAYAASLNPGAASFAPDANQSGQVTFSDPRTLLTLVSLYLGMCFFVTAFFWLAGTPATAALIRGNNYLGASMFSASVVLGGSALVCAARLLWVRRIGTKWV